MPAAHIPQCQYIRTDGRQCGSPKLKTKRYCYFHYEVHRAVANLDIPPLEDGNAIQLALTDLARAIVEERIALKPAALLAYILQTASANLKRVHLGVFPDRMITELPDLDPYARGLYPEPGERNRDPEQPATASAPEGRPRIAQGVSPGTGEEEKTPSTLPTASAQPAGAAPAKASSSPSAPTSSPPSAFQAFDPSEGHDFNRAKTTGALAPSALPKASAPEGRPRIAQGVSPGTREDEKIPSTLPQRSARPPASAGGASAIRRDAARVSEGHDFNRAEEPQTSSAPSAQTSSARSAFQASAPLSQKLKAAKAGSLRDARELLDLAKKVS